MTQPIELTGEKFGILTVIKRKGSDKHGQALWLCSCECGNKSIVRSRALRKRIIKSCGCLKPQAHGMGNTPEYRAWAHMKNRCESKRSPKYPDYGGRGITICSRWDRFMPFFEDMGKKPSPELTLERIDNNSGYSPSNCRWETRTIQNRNQRAHKRNMTGVRGVTMLISGKKYQASITTNCNKVHLGCFTNIEDAAKARKSAEAKYWGKP